MKTLTLASAAFLFTSSAFGQGDLAPPGAPAPTMKSLDQVEARIPVDATHTPGDSTCLFLINQSGSYYLTGDVTGVSGKNGIKISATNVYLDLNGYNLSGVPGSIAGVFLFAGSGVVRNGTVTNWGLQGINAAGAATDCQIHRVKVLNNGSHGVILSDRSVVTECSTIGNGGNGIEANNSSLIRDCVSEGNDETGILVNTGSIISHCTSQGNAQFGIYATLGSTISGCTVRGTLANGSSPAAGIYVQGRGRVVDCVSSGNQVVGINCDAIGGSVEGSSANANGDANHVAAGIVMTDSSVVAHCNCETNTGTGIMVGNGGRVFDCTVSKNGSGGAAGGILGGTVVEISDCTIWSNFGAGLTLGDHAQVTRVHVNNSSSDGIVVHSLAVVRECTPDFQTAGVGIKVTGSQNRIEANNVTRNVTGIQVTGTENVIIRNTASNTTANYSFVAGNRYGPILDLTSSGTPAVTGTGNSAAGTTLTTDPWANFAY
jgi:hypothetical protein